MLSLFMCKKFFKTRCVMQRVFCRLTQEPACILEDKKLTVRQFE